MDTSIIEKGLQYTYKGRKLIKRTQRENWIKTINASLRPFQNYSSFQGSLKGSRIIINRKMLSEISQREEKCFKRIVQETSFSKGN